MNQLPRNTEYIRATRIIRFGFGVSGHDSVAKGCVAKILERHDVQCTDGSSRMSVLFAGLGERNIHTPDIEAISEKEYFKGALKG